MMTEEINSEKDIACDPEEGEILEDGEIADDEDDIVAINANNSPPAGIAIKDEKENKESNQSKFNSFSSYYPLDRDDHFKPHKRKKKNNSKKRKRANSVDLKRKQMNDVFLNRNIVDVSHCLNDATFDSVELSDEDEYNFDMLDFDALMEILGCSINMDLISNVPVAEKSKFMLRIMKIMKQLHGNDPDTNRRFARLKRRTRERSISNSNGSSKYKAICKFYLEGKCHKGSDCYFSHDCMVPKRKDLCKFYLQGFCGKGEDCLFMHGEFPCKFFHTNTECYSGEKCRFSHAPLTEETREILRNYLDSGTLPDDPKPFRPHYPDRNKNFDTNEIDTAEFDSSFNYETEQLLSKPRPILLGSPPEKTKISYDTWKWQQELKELEKAYTGLKKNLFCIDEVFAIGEKPPTPRIEDDEDEVEAQIMNYYNDMLDTDELDEMVALQEIEEHQKKAKEEDERMQLQLQAQAQLQMQTQLPTAEKNGLDGIEDSISDEEKRLIEASAHDEDLRILPGNTTAFPPLINPVFDQVCFASGNTGASNNGGNSNFFSVDNFAHSNSFASADKNTDNLTADKSESTVNYSELTVPVSFSKQPSEMTAADVSNMVRNIRNGTLSLGSPPSHSTPTTSSTPAAVPCKPEFRDPRLKRLKENNRLQTSPTAMPQVEEPVINKPFIKVCNPNVLIEYKMVLVKVSAINYSCYFDVYKEFADKPKRDPRLEKFFTLINEDQQQTTTKNIELNFGQSSNVKNCDNESLITVSSLNPMTNSNSTRVVTPPMPTKIFSPIELISTSKQKEDKEISSPAFCRDPRIRSKDVEPRVSSDTNEENQLSPTRNQNKKLDEDPIKQQTLGIVDEALPEDAKQNTADVDGKTATNSSSIPAYALAAMQFSTSMYSDNILLRSYSCRTSENDNFGKVNFSAQAAAAGEEVQTVVNDSHKPDNDEKDDLENEEDDDSGNSKLTIDEIGVPEEEVTLKLSDETEAASSISIASNETPIEVVKNWSQIETAGNAVDSENEMEIDLQHHEYDVDSENENELIIASSSETEDNKDCDSQNEGSKAAIGTFNSVNC